MPTTPIYALRYPLATDPADVPTDLMELATDVETKLGGAPVSSLPGVPVDGQIVRYKVTANGPVWTLQYLSGSAAPYRWHLVGGSPLFARINAGGTPPAGWGDIPGSPGPSVTCPLAGVYNVHFGARLYAVYGSETAMIILVGAGGAVAGEQISLTPAAPAGSATAVDVHGNLELTVPTAATALNAKYSGGGDAQRRHLSAIPVRVG